MLEQKVNNSNNSLHSLLKTLRTLTSLLHEDKEFVQKLLPLWVIVQFIQL